MQQQAANFKYEHDRRSLLYTALPLTRCFARFGRMSMSLITSGHGVRCPYKAMSVPTWGDVSYTQ